MKPDNAFKATLNEARHPQAVMDAVLRAVDRMPGTQLDSLPEDFRPRRLTSRDDVEHWARRLDTAAALGLSARPLMRDLFTMALVRLDEIGPVRRRWP